MGEGGVPIIVGGTGLYLRVLFHGLFDAPTDPDLRDRLSAVTVRTPSQIYGELEGLDPAYARSISPSDGVRVVRALEVYSLLRRHHVRDGGKPTGFGSRGTTSARSASRERGRSCMRGSTSGWSGCSAGDGSRRWRACCGGYPHTAKPFQGIGYREIVLYLKGTIGHAGDG